MTDMYRRTFTVSALAFAFSPSLEAQHGYGLWQGEINSVYEAVLAPQCLCCKDKRAAVLINSKPIVVNIPRVETRSFTPLEKARLQIGAASYLQPSQDRIADAEQLISDLTAQYTTQLIPIDTKLNIPARHRFITPEEERVFFMLNPQGGVYNPKFVEQARAVPATQRKRLAHATSVWSLSPVAFNKSGSLALVLFRSSGDGCVNENWNVFERDRTTWKKLPWNNVANSYCT
jgi:hypothetical protein